MEISKTTGFFLIIIVFSCITETFQTKKVDCRKYVYAPVCRGVQARSALPALGLNQLPLVRGSRVKSNLDDDMEWKNRDGNPYYDSPLQLYFQKPEFTEEYQD